MPVNVDKNLTIKNNTLDASYGELFNKLNVAYAWTNTQTSGTTGTLASYASNSSFLQFIPCSNSSNVSFDCGCTSRAYGPVVYILNGELYINFKLNTFNNVKLGTKNDWKLCSCVYVNTASNRSFDIIAINTSGELYWIDYDNSTYSEHQIGTDTTWTDLSCSWGINNGKLYKISTSTAYQMGSSSSWTYLSKPLQDGGDSESKVFGINNNYYYLLYNIDTQPFQVISCNTAKYFRGYLNTNSTQTTYITGLYIDYNDDVYAKKSGDANFTKIGNIPNIIKLNGMYESSYQPITFITSDGKAGFIVLDNSTWSYYYFNESINWTDISYGMYATWYTLGDITSTAINICYAIGDGKLYEIRFSSHNQKDNDSKRIYTIKDNNTNWKKVHGLINPYTIYGSETSIYPSLYAYNSNDEVTIKSTIYTTKQPIGGDDAYYDVDLNKKSIISYSTASTVTDSFMTYNRDTTKDSTFTAIPPATIHETVSTIDFLRITNPNT